MSDPDNTYDLVVLGGGTGGYPAAIRGGQLGMKVAPRITAEYAKTRQPRFPISTENVPVLESDFMAITTGNDAMQREEHQRERREEEQRLLGFGEGARVRVLSEKKQVQDETPGAALVLADESALAKEFATKDTKVSSSRSYRSQDSYSRNQGFEAGRKANVGTTHGTSRKQIGA